MSDETATDVARRRREERKARQRGETGGDQPSDLDLGIVEIADKPESSTQRVELSELDKRSEENRAGDRPAHIREGDKGGFGS